ncbi:unnamed protein product [Adineta steineri]|uniref:Exonuclease domain-containing protein n=1 Tax=Adineta steineri TaxID=433720 RepID=A0A814FZQ4_9BILA|nr:unnamed protein product [Adineta steineri]
MLENLHLPFHGNLHSGLDDAKNIGKIIIQLIKDGCILMPNELYVSQSPITSRRPRQSSAVQYNPTNIRCHFKYQSSSMKDTVKRKQRSESYHSRSNSDQSLFDLPFQRTTSKSFKY